MRRNALRKQQAQLERQLYQLLPLKPRLAGTRCVGCLTKTWCSVEFQRYDYFDSRKKLSERWGEARYLALVLDEDGSIKVVDLGLADLIDRSIEKR